MKNSKLLISMTAIALFISCSNGVKVSSPDGAVTAHLTQQQDRLVLAVSLHGSEAAHWQIDGMALANEKYDFTGTLEQKGVSFAVVDETYTLPTGKVSAYHNHANEMTVRYANAHGKIMQLLVRAYNDGIAFRYAFDNDETVPVKEERTTLVIPEESNVWAMTYRNDSEGYYLKRAPSEMTQPLYHLPALVETPQGQWLLIHEADVLGRSAAAALSAHAGEGRFPLTTAYPELERGDWMNRNPWAKVVAEDGNKVMAFPHWATPWRMLIVGDTPGAIVESIMTENLNPPSVVDDQSWIKPGVAVFPWWGNNHANGDKELLKAYIDMAQTMTWNVLEFDVSLIGSPDYAREFWLTTPWIEEVTAYARERNVLVYGWDERRNLDTSEKRTFIFNKYKELGVDGIKIDFVNSYRQRACDFRQACLSDAAKHRLLVSFHGEYTPRGERRTYPNLMTQEGIKGAEYYLFASDNDIPTPQHNATVPFTRNVVGPMDYTPTAYSTPRRSTSYAHETALPFVYESGWVVMCDRPEYYLQSPARPVLQEIEASWDEIRFLDGYPGEFVVVARRKGEKWTIGALNAGKAKEVTVSLDFLRGNEQSLLICEDDKTDPHNQCIVRTASIGDEKALTFKMADNGGFVVIIK
jgi:alpha-glucosidase